MHSWNASKNQACVSDYYAYYYSHMFELKGITTVANATEVQRDFGRVVRRVKKSDVIIIRNNLPIAALVSLQRLAQVQGHTSALEPLLQPAVPDAAQYFVEAVQQAPPRLLRRLKEIILYGSCARGTATDDSDIDLLIVVDRLDQRLNAQLARWATISMAKTDYRDFLVILPRSQAHWSRLQRLGTAFAKAVERDGVTVWKNS